MSSQDFAAKALIGGQQSCFCRMSRWLKQAAKCWQLYVLVLPAIVSVIIFHYIPIYGVQIAFKNYRNSLGIWGSPWIGLKHFIRFVTYLDFWSIIRNTISISLYSIITFPCSIILALLINELTNLRFKKSIQMITYAPHFISTVVIVSMLQLFFNNGNGLVNNIAALIGQTRVDYLSIPKYFSSFYVWSGVWQNLGWGTIIYLAALAGVSAELIEAAKIDGAGRLRIIWHINVPQILPTIITLLILSTGSVLSVGFEKIYLMQNSLNLDVSRVISTYVYEMGIKNQQLSYSAAIGLFNNIINIIIISIVNFICNKTVHISIW